MLRCTEVSLDPVPEAVKRRHGAEKYIERFQHEIRYIVESKDKFGTMFKNTNFNRQH
jgi:hypothetical protein